VSRARLTHVIVSARDKSSWGPSLDAAVDAVKRGEAIILPTDTVYGVGCDAFNAPAVAAMLAAKGRGRQAPSPVLVSSAAVARELAADLSPKALSLMAAYWPGPLTLVVKGRPDLTWDLGDTNGTVALRVPNHPAALALLARSGPLAVTSANLTGEAPSTTADDAERALGGSVAVILDGGPSPLGEASTIIDVTGERPSVIRFGAIGRTQLERVLGPGALFPDQTPEGDAA
jgi:L-threonylcarbamoyladenylate synthase